jgi:hypothetical protein
VATADNIAGEYVDEVLKEWAPYVVGILREALKARGLILTEDLYDSFKWDLMKATAAGVAEARLSFRTHGRWRDMRTIRNFKQPPVDVIMEEFVKQIGVSKFKYIPGYENSRNVPVDSRVMRRIAWGISRGILKKNTTKARKWYSKNFYGAVETLIENLMAKYQLATSETVVNNLNDGNQ